MKRSSRPSFFEVVSYIKGGFEIAYKGNDHSEALAAYEKEVVDHPSRSTFMRAVWHIQYDRVLRSQKMPPGVPKMGTLPKRVSVTTK